jgi:uncharacterized delta-60 repeat protein
MKLKLILSISYLLIILNVHAQTSAIKLDTSFNTFDNNNITYVNALVKQSNKLVVAGLFNKIAGVQCNNICRLLNDSVVDPTFITGTGFNNEVKKIVVLPSDKMYVMGAFTSYSNVNINYLMRLNPNGTPDLTFVPNFDVGSVLKDFAVQSDGMLVVIGQFNKYSGYTRKNIVRLKTNGSLDVSFNSGDVNNGVFNKVLLQSTDKIILAGEFTKHLSKNVSGIVRLLSTGEIDNTFSCVLTLNGNNVITLQTVFIHANDEITIPRRDLYPMEAKRYDANGGLLYTYSFELNEASVLLPDGNFLTSSTYNTGGGTFPIEYTPAGNVVKKYNTTGWYLTYDFSYDIPSKLFSIDGITYMGCNYYETYTPSARRLVRLTDTNEIDFHFLPRGGPNYSITDVAKHSLNKYILIGGFTRIGSAKIRTIAMVDSTCVVDPMFNPGSGFNGPALCLAIQTDGKILVGGDFSSYNNQPAPHIVRLMPDGSIDPEFNIGSGVDYPVYDIQIIDTDKILVAGVFGQYQGIEVSNIVCLNMDGSANTAFNSNAGTGTNGRIRKMYATDANIYLIGDFNFYNGNMSKHIVRLNIDGTYDETFNPGQGDNGSLNDAVEYNNKLYVVGNFTMFNSQSRNSIAKLNLDGTMETSFYDPTYNGGALSPGMNVGIFSNALIYTGCRSTLMDSGNESFLSSTFHATSFDIGDQYLTNPKGIFYGDLFYGPKMSDDSSDYYLKHVKFSVAGTELYVFGTPTYSIGNSYEAREANFIVKYKGVATAPGGVEPPITTGINNFQKANTIYFVSNADEVLLVDSENSKGELHIFNINGVEIYAGLYQTNTSIDMPQMNSGVYFIKYVSEGQNVKVVKIVKN